MPFCRQSGLVCPGFDRVCRKKRGLDEEKGHGRDRNPLISLEPAGGIEPSILADYESDGEA
jgi:hypothetical protein